MSKFGEIITLVHRNRSKIYPSNHEWVHPVNSWRAAHSVHSARSPRQRIRGRTGSGEDTIKETEVLIETMSSILRGCALQATGWHGIEARIRNRVTINAIRAPRSSCGRGDGPAGWASWTSQLRLLRPIGQPSSIFVAWRRYLFHLFCPLRRITKRQRDGGIVPR